MNITPEESQRLVQASLGHSYDEKSFRQLVANILPDAERLQEGFNTSAYIRQDFQKYIASYKRIAKLRKDKKIDVLVVKLKNPANLRNARVTQRQFIASYLNGARGGTIKDAALVAFHADGVPDWRFSLVYKDYIFRDGSIQATLSEPKRSSFLVGENELSHTAEQQFVDLLQNEDKESFTRIRDAFSVERVTKEFFKEYKSLYLELSSIIQNDIDKNAQLHEAFATNHIKADVYAKRMLGQIVFLYFLQKKGWLGVDKGQKWGCGPHDFLQNLFRNHHAKDFFSECLNPLFYEALATDRSADAHFFPRLGCRIPFLNGGLFEPLNGYDWKTIRLHIPNSFFEKLFATFDRFNFTVREDEPLESEVAVDPEMLGKVFEGLLDVGERRERGTFYTPRHIVHYMCRESLIQYLDRAINLVPVYVEEAPQLPGMPQKGQTSLPGVKTKEKSVVRWKREKLLDLADINIFIRNDEQTWDEKTKKANIERSKEYGSESSCKFPPSIKKYAQQLDRALARVKVCDPAIGSGAFAVGMMHEIVRARSALRNAYQEQFPEKLSAYDLKRHTIAESIHGVDIDPASVDIAKLRLWLSLVVDENDFDRIKPLPNLDYKIMVGNSLDAANSKKDTNPLFNREIRKRIIELQHGFFNITDHERKEELRTKISELRDKCGDIGNFDWYIDFANTAGSFDILIGNPPYIQIQGMDASVKKLKPDYKTFASTGDVYCLFYELGFNLLKKYGILAFITSNKWMRAAYGKALRDFFLKNTRTIQLIDFAGSKVFDSATVDVNIMIFEKGSSDDVIRACVIKEDCSNNMSEYIEHNPVFTQFEVGQSWAILPPIEASIKRKIEAIGTPLRDWDVRINYGIKTGYNEAFIISGAKKDELIAQDPKSAEIIRPILRGKDIKRYYYKFADQWVIATFPSRRYNIESYPAVKKHLLSFGRQRLEQTGREYEIDGIKVKARKKTNNKWFETQDSISYWDE